MRLSRAWMKHTLMGGVVVALGWQLWPAWQLWQNHEAQWAQLNRQRMSMLQAQQEVQALRQKPIPIPAEALAQIQAISRQRFGTAPVSLPGATVQISVRSLPADQLALGWHEIRERTSASVVQADLNSDAQGWTGSLVFKLAQKP